MELDNLNDSNVWAVRLDSHQTDLSTSFKKKGKKKEKKTTGGI